ncbi:MAG: hypothetical protein IJU79_03015 [Desulfovibrionaceae bacterium]|nr:hypothetical protein [Desulfovibrionaceae bacterium]
MGDHSIDYGIDYMAKELAKVSKKQKLFTMQISSKSQLMILGTFAQRAGYLCLPYLPDGALGRHFKLAYPLAQASRTDLLSPQNPEYV